MALYLTTGTNVQFQEELFLLKVKLGLLEKFGSVRHGRFYG